MRSQPNHIEAIVEKNTAWPIVKAITAKLRRVAVSEGMQRLPAACRPKTGSNVWLVAGSFLPFFCLLGLPVMGYIDAVGCP